MEIEQLLQALVDGDISPAEFKKQAEEVKLPMPPKLPPWMVEAGEKPRVPARPVTPSERIPWENLPSWMDEC